MHVPFLRLRECGRRRGTDRRPLVPSGQRCGRLRRCRSRPLPVTAGPSPSRPVAPWRSTCRRRVAVMCTSRSPEWDGGVRWCGPTPCRPAITRPLSTRRRTVAAGLRRSPSTRSPTGGPATTRWCSPSTSAGAHAVTMRSSCSVRRPIRRTRSCCSWPPTPGTPTTTSAAATCTRAARSRRCSGRWPVAICGSRPVQGVVSPPCTRPTPT